MNQHIRKTCLMTVATLLFSCGQPLQTAEPMAQDVPPVVEAETNPLFPSSEDQAIAVVRDNTAAVNDENLQASMATIHPDSPIYQPTEEATALLINEYDIRYTLEEVSVVSISEDEARIYFVQLTEKISGPDFANNRVEGIHVLRKYQGDWKIYNSEAIDVTYLDR